ncbi:hypothetical protein ACO1O0_009031 [Amphichorda felina]
MASLKMLLLVSLAATALAMPASTRLTGRQLGYYDLSRRQNEAAVALGLGDLDILQFALTLEHLEAAFYQQALVQFPDAASMGLQEHQLNDLHQIAATESQHVSTLQSALAQAGIAPVHPCTYDFSAALTDPATLLATAAILENIGVSAYLGAAALVVDVQILAVAASIVTIEARHQTALRFFSSSSTTTSAAIPQAFDAALGLRSVFSLAAPFISSCPNGSALALEPFPTLAMADASQDIAALIAAGLNIQLTSEAGAGATHCAFTSGGVSVGGTVFSPYSEADGCAVPKGVAGVSYVALANSAPLDGILTDDITVAGPIAMTIT